MLTVRDFYMVKTKMTPRIRVGDDVLRSRVATLVTIIERPWFGFPSIKGN